MNIVTGGNQNDDRKKNIFNDEKLFISDWK